MIRIFVIGGTFDKRYNELTGEFIFQNTSVPEMLKLGRCTLNIDIRTLMMIDSLDMTDADRQVILEECRNAKEDKIVITHGTDTMPETAKVLGGGLAGKTIVLTGAMVPYAFGGSDGMFNLGCAIAFAQTLPSGVYIAMNGKYFSWNNVRKNKTIGEFEAQA